MARFVALTTLIVFLAAVGNISAAVPEKVRFNRDVRPILSNNCLLCHGPDEKHREADLRLDEREGALADLGGHAAIVPGKPDASELIKRITSHDDDERMPPPASKKPRLTAEQIGILRRWIEQGAEYEGHWSFLPLARVELPAVNDQNWVQNPIDRFILARLEAEGMSPSREAARDVLIRRVSLDLTGLLPTPEEVAAFVSDPDPRAYETLVDRLLASPHFGERWGRHWLDQSRYADSNGYTIDSERTMWPFRDWVIKAVNDDMPFDQFTIEQLAGDLLPNPTKNQLIATAFHRNTLINEEGGTDREQFRHEAVVDRVNTTGVVWLGLTVGCAQCHTHKFDPISHREYYELFAFMNHGADINNKGAFLTVQRGEVFGAAPPETPEKNEAAIAARQAKWEQEQLAALDAGDNKPVTWSPVSYVSHGTTSGAELKLLEEQSLLTDGRAAPRDSYRITFKSPLKEVAAVRLRVLTHDSLPRQGPGTASNGNFVLTSVKLAAGDAPVKLASAFADHEQPMYSVLGTLDDDPKSGWAVNVARGSTAKLNANHEAVFILEKPLAAEGAELVLTLAHELNDNYLIGRLAIDVVAEKPTKPINFEMRMFLVALRTAPERRNTDEMKLVRMMFEKEDPEALAQTARRTVREIADVMIMRELSKPRETFIALRGDFLRPDKTVGPLSPGVLKAVPPALPESEKRTRLELAKWLVHPENPLTPRVTMNRLWMRYFGRGLVETEEDFGKQGTPPSHPELLDFLASEFIRRGWSQKAIHRMIVTSSTYRQSSSARPDLAERDPRNVLLARQERLRVEAEVVRDAALSASGLLRTTIGGPSVRPPQAEGVYAFTQNVKPWNAAQGDARYRRGMYTMFYRSAPHPLFSTFDTPDFQVVCTRRARSNTPLQALTVANDEAFVEFATALAERVTREVPEEDLARRLKRAFALCLCREPSARELAILTTYYERQLTAAPGAKPRLTPLALACRAILNTDNFITRE